MLKKLTITAAAALAALCGMAQAEVLVPSADPARQPAAGEAAAEEAPAYLTDEQLETMRGERAAAAAAAAEAEQPAAAASEAEIPPSDDPVHMASRPADIVPEEMPAAGETSAAPVPVPAPLPPPDCAAGSGYDSQLLAVRQAVDEARAREMAKLARMHEEQRRLGAEKKRELASRYGGFQSHEEESRHLDLEMKRLSVREARARVEQEEALAKQMAGKSSAGPSRTRPDSPESGNSASGNAPAEPAAAAAPEFSSL